MTSPDATTSQSAGAPSVETPVASAVSAAAAGEDLVDHEGDSPETAVAVPVDETDEGVGFENNWIFDRYGRFRRNGGGVGTLDTRHYSVVEIELPNGETKKVYFDITDLWNAWKPPQK